MLHGVNTSKQMYMPHVPWFEDFICAFPHHNSVHLLFIMCSELLLLVDEYASDPSMINQMRSYHLKCMMD